LSGTGRFLRHHAVNGLIYVLVAVAVGAPAIAIFVDLSESDGSPLVAGFWLILTALAFLSVPIALHLAAYLTIVYWMRRRIVAMLLSPLAIGSLFAFAQGPTELAIVLVAGAFYGLSVDLPRAGGPWWRDRRALAAAAAVWVASLGAVELVQRESAGVQTDVTVTVEGARFRLACEYDRAGRVLGAVRRAGRVHPGGEKACTALEDAARTLDDHGDELQHGCPAEARRGRVDGKVAGRPFRQTVVVAACEDDAFIGFERDLIVPAP
jgi:hypothetical protein